MTAPLTIYWQSKHPHSTWYLVFDHPTSKPPTKVLAALNKIGFKDDGLAKLPPLDGREQTTVGKDGTGLFGAWTKIERTKNLVAARKILADHGYFYVPHHKLTFQDLI